MRLRGVAHAGVEASRPGLDGARARQAQPVQPAPAASRRSSQTMRSQV
ncbi:hypothetical protein [Dactylosporangium matsuzakiense]|nr:hypothetical protein [Dactylosporangium matsuzakiense]